MTIFSIPIRVYYEDTDKAGVVYYANYLKFIERARTEWLRARGLEQSELSLRGLVVFAVRSANIEFLKPARLDDLLQVTATVSRLGRASATFDQTVERDGIVLCRAEVKIACLDANTLAPTAFPDSVLQLFEAGRAA